VSSFKSATAAFMLLPTIAFAQTENTEVYEDHPSITGTRLRTDIIVTATGTDQFPEKTGQSITLINRSFIEAHQSTSVADLLANTPGITISRNGGPGQTTAVRIRGAEDSHTLVLIDGVRVNDPSSPAGSFDFGSLTVGNIERIEVLRGPNSVPWGSAAIGGVVNIVTGRDQGLRVQAEYGSRNATQIVAQGGTRLGAITASLGGGYFTDDGISAFKNGRENDAFRRWALNGRIGVDIADNLNLDLRGWYADSKVSFDGFPPPTFAFADTSQFSKTKQLGAYAGLKLETGPVKHTLAFTLGNTARDSFSPPATTPDFIARGLNQRIEYRGDAELSDAIRAVFGADREWTRFRDDSGRYSTFATSGHAQLIVTPIESLTLTGGIRVDNYKTYGTKTTFSANAAWRISDGTVLRAAYGEGFKAPTLFQLFSFYGNDSLKPETARSFEFGVEQSLIERSLTIGITAFQRDTTDQINFTETPPRADRPFGYYFNVDRTRTQGIEAFITARPDDRLTLTANYSLIDSKDRKTGFALLRRPVHSINASIDWTGPVNLGADIRLTSDSIDEDFNMFPSKRVSLDGYALVTLRAAWPIREGIELYGRVENLFDETYETVLNYGTIGRGIYGGIRVAF
jgi:vitamin B12 transporter